MEESIKLISIISSNIEAWIEEVPNLAVAEKRLQEIEATNDECLETTGNVFIIKGEILSHNFKNLEKIKVS